MVCVLIMKLMWGEIIWFDSVKNVLIDFFRIDDFREILLIFWNKYYYIVNIMMLIVIVYVGWM